MSDIIKLEYNSVNVRNNGEMLNLTDMWKANGSDPSKRPDQWLRYAGKEFVEFIEENLKAGNPSIELIRTERGGKTPGTWAHWQIGMAYAKYLSHEFHAHCNAIVRAHMEGRKLSQEAFQGQIIKTLETKFGAMLEEKIGQVSDQLAIYRNDTKSAATRLGERLDHIERHRHGLLSEVDATELRRQITEAAHLKIQLGDIRKPIAVYQEVDGMIRRAIDYPNQRGAKWDLCPLDKGTRAFSQIGMFIHSLSADLAKKRAAEKKAAAEKQIEMFRQAVGA